MAAAKAGQREEGTGENRRIEVTMNKRVIITWVVVLLVGPWNALALAIAPDKVDEQRVFWGDPKGFETPAEVDYKAVVLATPEYSEMKKKKVEKGSAKFWILLNNASERALRAIGEVAVSTEYDLVVDKGFLGALEPPLEGGDITTQVLDKLAKKN